MQNLITTLTFALMFMSMISKAQTAVNFAANDCDGVSHTLFNELDSGNVIVLVWVMPCGSCIGPAVSAYTEVQNYASPHPGRVKFYLVDDFANTSCASLSNWGSTNGITSPDAVFSSNSVSMMDYGTIGMPKIVVLGQNSHTVYFNQNNELNVIDFNTGVMNALGLSSVSDFEKKQSNINIYPNPIMDKATINFELTYTSSVNISIVDATGKEVMTILNENQFAGKHSVEFNTFALARGLYFATIITDEFTHTSSFSISK